MTREHLSHSLTQSGQMRNIHRLFWFHQLDRIMLQFFSPIEEAEWKQGNQTEPNVWIKHWTNGTKQNQPKKTKQTDTKSNPREMATCYGHVTSSLGFSFWAVSGSFAQFFSVFVAWVVLWLRWAWVRACVCVCVHRPMPADRLRPNSRKLRPQMR